MNIRKPTDYSAMYAALDALVTAALPQMELYCEIGRLVSARPEKGAAVAASEYLQAAYPDAAGFSPRNLRRMREFYRIYESTPELMRQAMRIGWTQNVVILEAELTMEEREWYLQAAERFGWAKAELTEQIHSAAHLEIALNCQENVCYTDPIKKAQENGNNEDALCLLWQYLQKPDCRVYYEGSGEKSWAGGAVPNRIGSGQHRGDWLPSLSNGAEETGRAWNRLLRQNGPAAPKRRLRGVRLTNHHGSGQPPQHVPYMWRRLFRQDAPPDGLHRPSWRSS